MLYEDDGDDIWYDVPFAVRVTAKAEDANGQWVYTFEEVTVAALTDGAYVLCEPGRYGPARDRNNREAADSQIPFYCQAQFRGVFDGVPLYELDVPEDRLAQITYGDGQTVTHETGSKIELAGPIYHVTAPTTIEVMEELTYQVFTGQTLTTTGPGTTAFAGPVNYTGTSSTTYQDGATVTLETVTWDVGAGDTWTVAGPGDVALTGPVNVTGDVTLQTGGTFTAQTGTTTTYQDGSAVSLQSTTWTVADGDTWTVTTPSTGSLVYALPVTHQEPVTVEEHIILDEQASAPATPAAGTIALYGTTAGELAYKDDAGAVTTLDGTATPSFTEGTLAATGSTQGDAAAITTDNVYVTGADGTKGVILAGGAGARVVVYNSVAPGAGNELKVYPPSGAQINAAAANAADLVVGLTAVLYARTGATQWVRVN